MTRKKKGDGMIWGTSIGLLIIGLLLLKHMLDVASIDHVKRGYLRIPNFRQKFSGFTIFFISDIDRRNISNVIIDKAKGKADRVIIGGDLTEKGVACSQTSDNVCKLKTHSVESYLHGEIMTMRLMKNQFTQTLSGHGVTVIKNDIFYMCDEQVAFIGLDDFTQNYLPLEPIFKQKNAFQILLCHNPADPSI